MDRFEILATVTNDCLIDWDIANQEIWRYEGPAGFMGFPQEMITDRRWWIENVHPEDRDTVLGDFYRAKDDGITTTWSAEYRFKSTHNTIHVVLEKGQICRDSAGRAIRYIGAIRDITDQKRQQEKLKEAERNAETSSRAKNHFINHMNHELRAPLASIQGLAKSLLEGGDELKSKQKSQIEEIASFSKKVLDHISQILEFSALSQDKFQIVPSTINIHRLVEEWLTTFDTALKEKSLTVAHQIEVETDLVADEKALTIAISNLLKNAIQFTPFGGHIELKVWQNSEETTLLVSDNGIGIAPENSSRIFLEFEQIGEDEDRTNQGGLGLGLSISKRLIEAHGGKIWVESTVGTGSSFFITLPNTLPAIINKRY
jgi:PAS domain S-box-containing protein